STAVFVRSYIEALTGRNLIHFQAGQETKKTMATRPRIAPEVMNRRFMGMPPPKQLASQARRLQGSPAGLHKNNPIAHGTPPTSPMPPLARSPWQPREGPQPPSPYGPHSVRPRSSPWEGRA